MTAIETEPLRATDIIRPGDPLYDDARRLWNATADKRPALIVRPRTVEGVSAAVRYAVAEDFRLAVKGGGHSVPGHSSVDDGLMLDIAALSDVHVDPQARLARVGGGALLGDLDRAAQEHGLVVPAGHVSHTGVGGLTLGGGTGWLMRKLGLTIDSLVEAQVVLASGDVVRAAEDEHPDLFWALRGGGGNFGVVTEFTFRLHEHGPIALAGMLVHPFERAAEALRHSRDFMRDAPEELTTFQVLFTAPPAEPFAPELRGKPVLAIGVCHSGPVEEGERVIAPLRGFGAPQDLVAPMPHVALQTMLDATAPHGLRNYNRSHWLRDLDDDVIDTLVRRFAEVPAPLSQVILGPMGGAVARVPSDATAFAARDAGYLVWLVGTWTDPGSDDDVKAWVRRASDDVAPYSIGVYVNALDGDEGLARVRAAYGANWERLREVKRRYDPENVFRLNQNIEP